MSGAEIYIYVIIALSIVDVVTAPLEVGHQSTAGDVVASLIGYMCFIPIFYWALEGVK